MKRFASAWDLTLAACLVALAQSLSAIEWQAGPGFRSAELPVPATGKTGFTLLAPETTGILFTNFISDQRSVTNQNVLNGSGVALGDVDGDGLCDVYLCRLNGGNSQLFRNLGNWKFQDITDSAGVGCGNQDSTGAVFADIDGDGDLDLLVNSLGGGTRVFENDGQGHFKEVTAQAGVASKTASMSMALADVDGDGDLDLYVTNFRFSTVREEPNTVFSVNPIDGRPVVVKVNGKPASNPEYAGRFSVAPNGTILEYGEVDVLYLNDGKGHFTALSFTNGGFFLDEDGKPLTEPPRDWGLAVQFYDLNGDGAPDIYVCNDLFTPDRIWINDGKGKFRAIDRLALRDTSTFSMGIDCGDLTFEEMGAAWGFNTPGISRGMALADLDGDGDLDVVVNNFNAAAGVYRNESAAPRVAVRLKGLPPNTRGIGAKIWVYGGAVPMQSQEMICGGRYLSSDAPMRVLAAGSLTNAMRIEVQWRNGKRSVVKGVHANRIY